MPTQEDRLQYIGDATRASRFVSLREIAERFDVTIQTARRDVALLHRLGKVEKVHGGAVPRTEPDSLSLSERLAMQDAEKIAVAQAAADLISDGDIVLMDGGSTTARLAECIKGRPVQVITNSMRVAQVLKPHWPETEIILVGGYYYPKSELMLGPIASRNLRSVHANKAFFGAVGVTEEGPFNSNHLVVEFERTIIEQSMETYLLVDSSKLGRSSLMRVCPFGDLDAVVTVGRVDEEIAEGIRGAGCRLILADS